MTARVPQTLLRSLQGTCRLYGTAAAQTEGGRTPLVKQGPKLTKLKNGMTVASVENYSPISHVAVVVKAGSRYEEYTNLGMTHALRVLSALGTPDLAVVPLVKGIQQTGADFSCTATREYMIYSTASLRNKMYENLEKALEVALFGQIRAGSMNEFRTRLATDIASSSSQETDLLEALHGRAFRNTLGRSLFATEAYLDVFDNPTIARYQKNFFTQGRVAVVGTGVDHDDLIDRLGKVELHPSADIKPEKAIYTGGEVRNPFPSNMTEAAVVTEGPSLNSKDLFPAGVLQMIMGTGPSIKYSDGSSAKLNGSLKNVMKEPFSISCINANYTDSGLFGFYLIANSSDAEKGLKEAFNIFANITKTGLTDEDVSRGKNKLKAVVAEYMNDGFNMCMSLGEQALDSNKVATFEDIASAIDAITSSDVTNVAKKLVNGKVTMASSGNLESVPFLEDLSK